MARVWTFGVEEVSNVADLTKLNVNAASAAGLSISSSTKHGQGTKSLQFASATACTIVRTMIAGKTNGTYFARMYAYWSTFGTTPNSTGTLMQWIDLNNNVQLAVQFNPSTKIWSVINNATGSAVATLGTNTTTTTATWYRVELMVTVATDASGAFELRIYAGEASTPMETITFRGATLTAGLTYDSLECGNSGGLAWGTLFGDDFAVNDDSGTSQASWCGPEVILAVYPSSNDTVAWSPSTPPATIGAVAAPMQASPNMVSPNQLTQSGGGGSALPAFDNVNDLDPVNDTGAVNDTTYQLTSLSDGISDRFNTTSISPTDVVSYTVIDVYARTGMGAGSGTLKLRLWDGANIVPGPPIIPPSNAFRNALTEDHLAYDLTGKTASQVSLMDIGYFSDNGTGEKRVSALWANIGYIPNGLNNVASAVTHNYAAVKAVSAAVTPRYATQVAINASALTPYEANGTVVAVSNSKTSQYESLKALLQSF